MEFRLISDISDKSDELTIFIHGYSAIADDFDLAMWQKCMRDLNLSSPGVLLLWDSGHILGIGQAFEGVLYDTFKRNLFAATALTVIERGVHFYQSRSRSDELGVQLIGAIKNYTSRHCPLVKKINLIGHSLGSRLIISCLKGYKANFDTGLVINDVLLMGGAVELSSIEAKELAEKVEGLIVNAYSKDDYTLILNFDETCIGRHEVDSFNNICMDGFGHMDYWPKLKKVIDDSELVL